MRAANPFVADQLGEGQGEPLRRAGGPPQMLRDEHPAEQLVRINEAVSQLARESVTVAVGGEGADELFGGYPRYRWLERSLRVSSSMPAAANHLLEKLMGQSGRLSRARRVAMRLGPSPLLERNLD